MRENSFIKEKSAKYLYEDYYRKYINQIVEILEDISSRGGKIAIWGYGLKGIAFLNAFIVIPRKISSSHIGPVITE